MPANSAPPPAKKKGRRARLIVIVLVLALVAGIGYGAYWGVGTVRASLPQTTGTIQLKGLSGPVDVERDSYGVPQIYANSDADLFRAQGYVQAQDRFYEMDVRRHMTSGRLSEMFGKSQVDTDAFLRTLGWQRVAQQEYDHELSPETKKNLQAYSDGVNAYLKGRSAKDISVEYAALNLTGSYTPAKWTPVDSVAWLKAMAWDLRGNMQDEIDRSLMTSRLSEKQIDELYPPYPTSKNKPIVQGGAVVDGTFDPKASSGDGSSGAGLGSDDGTGSSSSSDGTSSDGTTSGGTTSGGTSSGTSVGTTGLDSAYGTGTGTGTNSGGATGAGLTANGSAVSATDAAYTKSTGSTGSTGSSDNASSASGATEAVDSQLTSLSDSIDSIPQLFGPSGSGSGIGSNSWVVSGKLTTTGKPLLANDPHLSPSLPSVWYQMGLHCRTVSPDCQYNVSGYTFSGMPGVIIGHNADIAWGLTNLGADVTDLYLEKVDGDTYQYGNEKKKFTTRKETIKIAGGGSKTIVVRSTIHGPVVSDRDDELVKVGKQAPVPDLAPDRGAGYAVSLQWTALKPGKTMDSVFALDKAQNFTQFRAAAHNFEVPSQNLVYADTEGNIGYQAPGKVPVRGKGDGSLPAPGWDPAYRWEKSVPFDAMPYEYDPDRGYIVTANQAVVDTKKYPYLLTTDWDYGTRSQRITDLIESKTRNGGKISTDDMQDMQTDNTSEIAKQLVPYLLKNDLAKNGVPDPAVRQAQKLLENWDYTQEPDSAAAAYFNSVWRNILELAFGDKLPKELRVTGQCLNVRPAESTGPPDDTDQLVRECGERPADTAQPDGGDRWFEVVGNILKDDHNSWWSSAGNRRDKATTTRDQLFARAMKDARWELTAKLGKDISTWSWGRLHQLTLTNSTLGTSGPGFMKSLLNRGPYNLGGGGSAVDATSWNAAGGYAVTTVPSMRMVVNVGDWDKSRWINLTGASGHAYSAHYTDQTKKWEDGDLLPWAFGIDAVNKATQDKLTLKP